jgi:hypothetical protein
MINATEKTTEEILLEFKRVASGVSVNIENPQKLLTTIKKQNKNGND